MPPAPLFTSIDVISVGDQLCEITAAIRLGALNPCLIRHIKLLLSLNFSRDRGATMSPDIFIRVNGNVQNDFYYLPALYVHKTLYKTVFAFAVGEKVDREYSVVSHQIIFDCCFRG